MTTLTLGNALPEWTWTDGYLTPPGTAAITVRSTTTLTWKNADASIVTLSGTGFSYSAGEPVAGTLTGITVKTPAGALIATFAGINVPLSNAYFMAFGYTDSDGFINDGSGAGLLNFIMNGNDTVNGSSANNDISGGRGNDILRGNGGDDFIFADPGADKVDGGTGYDWFTYQDSFFDSSAYRGANVNLATNIAVDCWGNTDTLTNIENLRGSTFADVITGSARDEDLAGLRGADILNGGGGFDTLYYWMDALFGGKRGIAVNLGTGKITDGFGSVDTVSGFEKIEGTIYADSFIGDANTNEFYGGKGADFYNGGNGYDLVGFTTDEATVAGANVNLNLATLQVQNDGYGNKETLVSIEDITGTRLGDTLIGNASENYFYGLAGVDTLNGGGGNDLLRGDSGADVLTGGTGADKFSYVNRDGAPWGDKITDFVSGIDDIRIKYTDFAGMTSALKFKVAASLTAADTGSWFYYNSTSDTLYWDANGGAAGGTVVVATFTNNVLLAAGDIELFA